MDKLKIDYPIIVEGKYDKIKITSVADAYVITTDGFGVFNKSEKLAVIRSLAKKTPIIVMTDSDGAGKLIRSHITSAIPKDRLIHLYTPAERGKEKRKSEPSAEGYLGVEGIDAQKIRELLAPFESASGEFCANRREITKLDFFSDGLSGGEGSAERREKLAKICSLPPKMTANALLSALNVLYSYEQYKEVLKKVEKS